MWLLFCLKQVDLWSSWQFFTFFLEPYFWIWGMGAMYNQTMFIKKSWTRGRDWHGTLETDQHLPHKEKRNEKNSTFIFVCLIILMPALSFWYTSGPLFSDPCGHSIFINLVVTGSVLPLYLPPKSSCVHLTKSWN